MRVDVGMRHWFSFQTPPPKLLQSSWDGESEFTEALDFHFLFIQQYSAWLSQSHLLPVY